MEVGKLTVQRRNKTGKGIARKLRAQGDVPGVCYGPTLGQPVSVVVNAKALKASLDPVKRQNTVIEVTVQEDGQTVQNLVAMVRDYQIDPIRRELSHVDLVAVDTEKEVEVQVPLEFTGKFKGAINGGQLHVVRHDLVIRCKPALIPANIEIDITELDIGDNMHVRDLKLAEGIIPALPGRLTVITCTAPEVEATPAGGEAAAGDAKAAAKPGAKGAAAKPAAAKGGKK